MIKPDIEVRIDRVQLPIKWYLGDGGYVIINTCVAPEDINILKGTNDETSRI